MNPNESLELEKGEAQAGRSLESKSEVEDDLIRGAELLEEPSDGSFLHGLQVFVAWVKNLISDDDKN
ncbi:MAG: hypothetical protein HY336_00935 [Candidatus Doudnabacteria bacterium]|nr:hypothetical protein [Candidatus Doudnabacteria bacterium]